MAMRLAVPVVVPSLVILLLWLLELLPASIPGTGLARRLEWITYDWRARLAAGRAMHVATNQLGAVFVSDQDLKAMNDGSYGYREKFPWPTYLYGRVVRELSRQGADVVGFDVLFELLNPGTSFGRPGGARIGSDEFFAARLREAGNVVLAAEPGNNVLPADLFRTNALAIASIGTSKDSDGVLRRTRAFSPVRMWHPLVRYVARGLELDLSQPRFDTDRIVFSSRHPEIGEHSFPLNPDGSLRVEAIMQGAKADGNEPACSTNRMWSLGIALAAQALGLDLDRPIIEQDRIILHGKGGTRRIIPIDADGCFQIDWVLDAQDPRIRSAGIIELIRSDDFREAGIETNVVASFKGRLVVIGVAATGGNVTDLGTTPLNEKTPLVMQHLNVANSIITGHFIGKPTLAVELLLIAVMGVASGILTWKLRALVASAAVFGVMVAYVATGIFLFDQYRYWVPFVLPLGGALLATHVCLITIRVRIEQRERFRIRSVFSKIVSPDVVNELLKSEQISLGGARRKVTVYFADIRGFTAMTDQMQVEAEESIRGQRLSGAEAEAYLDRQARDVLETVNCYLGVIADTVKKHRGTLDKYIGDCVMAFWGAPASSDRHALDAVLAAIEAQRGIYRLNLQRAADNRIREEENLRRQAAGQPPLPRLTLLALGSGISTGFVTVGLMGSNAHLLNYTVFGREVNLASRLEGLSGRGRIIISRATREELRRLDSDLAARCIDLPAQMIRGFRDPVEICEVQWRELSGDPEDYDTAVLKGDRTENFTEIVPNARD